MKRSELKEAIKSEIKSVLSENRYDINDPNSPLGKLSDEYESSGLKGIVDNYGLDVVLMMLSSGEYGDRLNESVLSEQSNNPDFDKKVASFAKKINNEMDYPGGVLEAMKQIKSRLERIISKVEDAKRGGAEEEPLMKMIGLKEAMFNEDAALEDIMLAIDLHLDGQIDYNEMSRRVEDLILGKEKSNFRVMNEGKRGVVIDADEIKNHLDQYDAGNIDGDDLNQAIEQILRKMMSDQGVTFSDSDIREDEEKEEDDDAKDKKAYRGGVKRDKKKSPRDKAIDAYNKIGGSEEVREKAKKAKKGDKEALNWLLSNQKVIKAYNDIPK